MPANSVTVFAPPFARLSRAAVQALQQMRPDVKASGERDCLPGVPAAHRRHAAHCARAPATAARPCSCAARAASLLRSPRPWAPRTVLTLSPLATGRWPSTAAAR